jgi:hypothetical protein
MKSLRTAVFAFASLCGLLFGTSIFGFSQDAEMVETGEYTPCGDGCAVFVYPTYAFCLKIGNQILVAEGRSYLHMRQFTAGMALVGKRIDIQQDKNHVRIGLPGGKDLRLKLGSYYEGFKNTSCIVAVHKLVLLVAHQTSRPIKVPRTAVAVAGSQIGDYHPLFWWYQCSSSEDRTTFDCNRWYPQGVFGGIDRYCMLTTQQASTDRMLNVDPVLSVEGRIVLSTGAVLQHDDRGRTNDVLDRPSEACRQIGKSN